MQQLQITMINSVNTIFFKFYNYNSRNVCYLNFLMLYNDSQKLLLLNFIIDNDNSKVEFSMEISRSITPLFEI